MKASRLTCSAIALSIVGILSTSSAPRAAAVPIGTAFTYQGKLQQSGAPVNNTADLRFRLYDAASGGVQVGTTQLVNNLTVVDGLFTTQIDFGASAFNGDARWLEIDVGVPAGGASFTTLAPRQPLTATPHSLQTRGLFVDPSNNVGIGTNLPEGRLDVRGQVSSQVAGGNSTNYEMKKIGPFSPSNISFALSHRSNGTEGWMYGYDGTTFRNFQAWDFASNEVRFPSTGNTLAIDLSANKVGIGTTNPLWKLDVLGDVVIGATNRYFVPGADENLRIIRGIVDGAGTILQGSGFTAQRGALGVYHITYSVPFATIPSSIVTPHSANSGTEAMTAELGATSVSGFSVGLRRTDGTFNDQVFHFVVIGPR